MTLQCAYTPLNIYSGDNDIIVGFQSAYKAGHSCETALLRVYNDIVITIGKGNGSFLVLLDLSAASDTIDHDNLFIREACRNQWQCFTADKVIFLWSHTKSCDRWHFV